VTPSPDISIVVPLYNEEECVERLFQTIKGEAEKLGRRYEVVFVDDGSRDRTFAICEQMAKNEKTLRVVKFRKNYGQTPAMAAGFEAARGQIIVTMDGDLQNNPADMTKILAKMDEGFDVVSGWRYDRQDDFFTRTFPSRIANWLISTFTGVRLHDYGCSLKGYRSKFLKPIRFYSDMHRFFPAIVATLAGARTAEIPVSHFPRKTGKSKYGLSRIFLVIADLLTILLITRFVRKPMYWFGILAIPFIVLGSILAGFSVLSYRHSIEASNVIPGCAFLVLGTVFHFLLSGMLSEYIISTGETDARSIIAVQTVRVGEERV
jgi:glycosyltransferase involved in cell wall biosynthesis